MKYWTVVIGLIALLLSGCITQPDYNEATNVEELKYELNNGLLYPFVWGMSKNQVKQVMDPEEFVEFPQTLKYGDPADSTILFNFTGDSLYSIYLGRNLGQAGDNISQRIQSKIDRITDRLDVLPDTVSYQDTPPHYEIVWILEDFEIELWYSLSEDSTWFETAFYSQ